MSEDRELQRETRVGVLEVRAGELRDATETVTHGVAMQEQLTSDRVQIALQSQVRLERVDELRVRLIRDERTEDALGERLDLARRLIEHQAIRTELFEVRRAPLTVERAADDKCVRGLHEREVRAGGAMLRPCDTGRDGCIPERGNDGAPYALRLDPRVGPLVNLAEHAHTHPAPEHARVGVDRGGDRRAQPRAAGAAREHDRDVPPR